MNKRITRLGIGLLFCYTALFVQLNRVQMFGARRLERNPENFRSVERDFDRPRGIIATADGIVVARSELTPGATFERARTYPEGDLFAQVSGFFSLEFGADGVEDTYNAELAGTTSRQHYRTLSDLLVDRDRSGDVILTLRRDVQVAAKAALGARKGSVVLLDPSTGGVIALWSWPSYDPNVLSSQDLSAARQARAALLADDSGPLLSRAFRERFPPGSTFKVVTAASGLESGRVRIDQPVYPPSAGYVPPASSQPIGNFGGVTCGGALAEAMIVSCNTAFAQMGAETVGPEFMIRGAAQFGFNSRPPFDVAGAAVSAFPTDFGVRLSGDGGPRSVYENSAALAQSSIGQNDVAASPLQMALVAAAVANDGVVASPHVVAEVRDAEGKVLRRVQPGPWRTAVSPTTAATLRSSLQDVVAKGTARGLALPGFTIGAKTGTAQLADDGSTNAWVIGYAGPNGKPPSVAFAVLVEADPSAGQQTGGAVAVPVALAVLRAALGAN